jgi:hypothetical protein
MKVRFMAGGVDPIDMTVRAPARNPPCGEAHGFGGLRYANPPYRALTRSTRLMLSQSMLQFRHDQKF